MKTLYIAKEPGFGVRDDLSRISGEITIVDCNCYGDWYRKKGYNVISKDEFFDSNDMRFDVVIGNPPYNKGLSVKFINKAAELSDYVHFVLPKAIRKPSQLNRIDPYLHIIEDVDCAPGTFTGAGDIPAVVQKFEKRNYKREKIVTYTEHPDFVFVKKSENPDLMIGRSGCGPTGKVWTENFSHYREDHYYIRVNKPEVVDTLKSLTEDFKRVAKTARMMSLSKHEIISLYCEKTGTKPL